MIPGDPHLSLSADRGSGFSRGSGEHAVSIQALPWAQRLPTRDVPVLNGGCGRCVDRWPGRPCVELAPSAALLRDRGRP